MTRHHPIRNLLVALLAAALLFSACSGESESTDAGGTAAPTSEPAAEAGDPEPTNTTDDDVAAPPQTESAVRGVLAPGPDTHLGLTWFSPPDPTAQGEILQRWDETVAASSVGRVMVDWIDVEPDAGVYELTEVDDTLREMVTSGRQPMLSVVASDVSGTDFPAWLDGFEPKRAAAAYLAMAEQLVPIMERHGVWMLAIANEPPLADEEQFSRDDFATFVELVAAGMDELAPGLATTFTFAGGDPLIEDPAIDRMIAAVDVFSVNHYCLTYDLQVIDMDDARTNIDVLVERAGDLPVVFQEFGCPASTIMGSSDEFQLEWFEVAYDHIAEIEQVRAAFVFEFLDWSQETFDADYGDAVDVLVAEVGQGFTDRFADWLLTSGLVRSDGSTRPAFDLFVETAPALAIAG